MSREWEHPGAGLEEDVHPGSDLSHPSQAEGKIPMPSSSAAQTCVEHPRTSPSGQTLSWRLGSNRAASTSLASNYPTRQRCYLCDWRLLTARRGRQ